MSRCIFALIIAIGLPSILSASEPADRPIVVTNPEDILGDEISRLGEATVREAMPSVVIRPGVLYEHPPIFVLGPKTDDGRRGYDRQEAVGRRVRLEGIAWGQPFGSKEGKTSASPHAGPIVLHEGGATFVRGVDFVAKHARGKTVRVEGVLRREGDAFLSFGGTLRGYYYIDAASFTVIDAVEEPNIVLLEPLPENGKE